MKNILKLHSKIYQIYSLITYLNNIMDINIIFTKYIRFFN
jgi:hypothetical protein